MKTKIKLVISLLLCTILVFSYTNESIALSKYGSRGAEVKKIQRILKKSNFYKGDVDGIYGSKTKAAVVKFQ